VVNQAGFSQRSTFRLAAGTTGQEGLVFRAFSGCWRRQHILKGVGFQMVGALTYENLRCGREHQAAAADQH